MSHRVEARGARTAAMLVAMALMASAPVPAAPTTVDFVFACRDDGAVAAYRIEASGSLSALRGSPFSGGHGRCAALVTVGSYLYQLDTGGALRGYAVNARTGALNAVPESPFKLGDSLPSLAAGVQMSADGSQHFLLLATPASPTLVVLAINPATGALSTTTGSPYDLSGRTGAQPVAVAADATHGSIYVLNALARTLIGFHTSSEGGLTALPASPYSILTAPGWTPSLMALTPDARFAYVVLHVDEGALLQSFAIDPATGIVTPGGAPTGAGMQPQAVVVAPSGRFLFLADPVLHAVTVEQIDQHTGAPSMVSGPAASLDQHSTASWTAMSRSGRYLLVSDGGPTLSVFAADSDGSLRSLPAVNVGVDIGALATLSVP